MSRNVFEVLAEVDVGRKAMDSGSEENGHSTKNGKESVSLSEIRGFLSEVCSPPMDYLAGSLMASGAITQLADLEAISHWRKEDVRRFLFCEMAKVRTMKPTPLEVWILASHIVELNVD
ncbi:hypothetical protein C8J56DRAFT_1068152 [Mycena floridula]|nr:hypothetical protein C8J56DRAFT_1068152 [Mycena floridula]